MNKYVAGFNECTQEFSRYLNSTHGLSDEIRGKMLGHLANCLDRSNNVMNASSTLNIAPVEPLLPVATQQPSANQRASTAQPLQIQTQPLMANTQGNLCVLSPAAPHQQTTFQSPPMQLVPAKLPTGETVFVLASSGNVIASNLNIAPVVPAQPAQNVISIVNSSIDSLNGNQESKRWSTPQTNISNPMIQVSSASSKPCTISKSPSSDDESVFDTRAVGRGHIKTSSPVLSDYNANISDRNIPFTMPSYTPIHSSASSSHSHPSSLSQTPTNFSFVGCQMRTPKSPLDDSRNESVSSTSDASISSPLQKDNDRAVQRPSSSASGSQQHHLHLEHSTSLLDPMWRPW